VSHGEHNGTCFGQCGYCYSTREALSRDTIVVAAAGNHEEGKPSVFCPAIEDDAIAVGGMVALCTGSDSGCTSGAYRLSGTPYEFEDRAYCGQQGCTDNSAYCIDNLRQQPWQGNPNPVDEKPDTLAPHHSITINKSTGKLESKAGTSFSAPLVTAVVAYAFSGLRRLGENLPNGYQLHQAIKDSNRPVRDPDTEKIDAQRLTGALLDEAENEVPE